MVIWFTRVDRVIVRKGERCTYMDEESRRIPAIYLFSEGIETDDVLYRNDLLDRILTALINKTSI